MNEPTKPIVYTENPFSYNYVSLKQSHVNDIPLPAPAQMVADPTYNAMGKFLGIDTVHAWNQNYEKVHKITEWAKERSGFSDIDSLTIWIDRILKTIPSLGAKRITNLYAHIKLMGEKRV
jgi:hypothetical protein